LVHNQAYINRGVIELVELWESYNNIRKFLAGKKTYINIAAFGILGALKFGGYPIPDFIWPILTALLGSSLKAAWDKVPRGGANQSD